MGLMVTCMEVSVLHLAGEDIGAKPSHVNESGTHDASELPEVSLPPSSGTVVSLSSSSSSTSPAKQPSLSDMHPPLCQLTMTLPTGFLLRSKICPRNCVTLGAGSELGFGLGLGGATAAASSDHGTVRFHTATAQTSTWFDAHPALRSFEPTRLIDVVPSSKSPSSSTLRTEVPPPGSGRKNSWFHLFGSTFPSSSTAFPELPSTQQTVPPSPPFMAAQCLLSWPRSRLS
mmetsp:Transcript_35166/g.98742  ORF Transcript_35166/g.98742 Transcript_35166/m.98742 type:complete len:230 (+) Transcript_35166:1359-2048(+)